MLFNLNFSKKPKNLQFEKTKKPMKKPKTKKPHDANYGCNRDDDDDDDVMLTDIIQTMM